MTKDNLDMYDYIIVGSGPAGYNGAIYLGNSGIKNGLLFSGWQPGGLLTTTYEVVNYLGFPKIGGIELTDRFRQHAQDYTTIIDKMVNKIVNNDNYFTVYDQNQKQYYCKYILIATGSSHKHLGAPGEQEFQNKGVSYCAVCDGMFFKDQIVMVIGGGDSAVEEAIYLANIAQKVFIVLRSDKFKAKQINIDQMQKHNNITILYNHQVVSINGAEQLESITFTHNNQKISYKINGLFVAIGQYPNSSLVKDLVDLDNQGYIKVNSSYQTSHSRIFASGDVISRDHSFKQAILSAAESCVAALTISKFIN